MKNNTVNNNTVRIKTDKYAAVAEDFKLGKAYRKIDNRKDRRATRLVLDGFCQ